MQLKYVGGLSEATLPGVFGSAKRGKTLEVEDEDRAAMAIESGDWELVDKGPAPKRKAPVTPTPQKG